MGTKWGDDLLGLSRDTARVSPSVGDGTIFWRPCAAFLVRASQFFAAHGVAIERVMTDNAQVYRWAHLFREAIIVLGLGQVFTRPFRPQTNGKVERFNRTLLEEWA